MGLSAKETVGELLKEMESFISTKTVVGEPININDTIILPLVDVSFGVGAGAREKGKDKDTSSGGTGGLGAKITPSAVLVIKDGQTKLVNIKKQDSVTKIIDMVPDILDKFKKKDIKEDKEDEEIMKKVKEME